MNLNIKHSLILFFNLCIQSGLSDEYVMHHQDLNPTELLATLQLFSEIKAPFLKGALDFLQVIRKKPYSGWRVSDLSHLNVSWHGNVVIVVEEDDQGNILNCEFVDTVQEYYRNALLGQLCDHNPREVSVGELLDTMEICQEVRSPFTINYGQAVMMGPHGILELSLLLRFIVPGTRWCGVSDVAYSFYELGYRKVDKCCRTHDFCPEFILALQSNWNLTNPAVVTRSHCLCDEYFKKCLLDIGDKDATTIGSIYFNILRNPCIEDTTSGKAFRDADTYPIIRDDYTSTTFDQSD